MNKDNIRFDDLISEINKKSKKENITGLVNEKLKEFNSINQKQEFYKDLEDFIKNYKKTFVLEAMNETVPTQNIEEVNEKKAHKEYYKYIKDNLKQDLELLKKINYLKETSFWLFVLAAGFNISFSIYAIKAQYILNILFILMFFYISLYWIMMFFIRNSRRKKIGRKIPLVDIFIAFGVEEDVFNINIDKNIKLDLKKDIIEIYKHLKRENCL